MLDYRYTEHFRQLNRERGTRFLEFVGQPNLYDFDLYCPRTPEDHEHARYEKFRWLAQHKHDTSLV